MKFISIFTLVLFLMSCNNVDKQNLGSFRSEILFITGNNTVSKINEYANNYSPFLDNTFIFYIDGACPLCSLDLMEIENIKKSIFLKNNITPIVIIYGKINDYTMSLIKEKDIFKFPIFNLSDKSYNEFIKNFEVNKDPLLIKKNGQIIYSGNPLNESKDMKKLVTTLKKIKK